MKILVTGGAGYIGSVLVPGLLAEGHEVLVVDNFMYGQSSLLDCCWQGNLTIIRGDARDESIIKDCLKDADIIIPLACLTGAPICKADVIGARSTNLEGIKLIDKLRSREQRVIYPTTNSGYGIGQEGIYCTEETPLNPISLYGKLKTEAESVLLDSGNCVTFRFATVFGVSPRMRLDLLVNDFCYRAFNDRFIVLFEAHFKRNYLHVRDAKAAFLHTISNFDKMEGEPYNVGLSEANISKWELCQEIKKEVPEFYFVEAEIGEDPDKRNYIVSNEKIESTGFKTVFGLNEGVRELIKAYKVIRENSYSNV